MPLALATFSQVLHTGQVLIPIGAHAFSVNVQSGQATIAGVVYVASQTIAWTAADNKLVLGSSIPVGATGVGNRTAVMYTT